MKSVTPQFDKPLVTKLTTAPTSYGVFLRITQLRDESDNIILLDNVAGGPEGKSISASDLSTLLTTLSGNGGRVYCEPKLWLFQAAHAKRFNYTIPGTAEFLCNPDA